MDLFGDDDEDDAEAERVKAERVAAYSAKKAAKPKTVAKVRTILLLSICLCACTYSVAFLTELFVYSLWLPSTLSHGMTRRIWNRWQSKCGQSSGMVLCGV